MDNAAELTAVELPQPFGLPVQKLSPQSAPVDEAMLSECVKLGLAAIRAHYPRVPVEESEDIVQELVVIYLTSPERIKQPMPWFFVCARRRAQKYLINQHQTIPIPESLPLAQSEWEMNFMTRQMLRSLRGDSRTLMSRIFVAGFTVREIAAAEGCTPQAVYLRLAQDMKRLRCRMNPARPAPLVNKLQ